MKTTLFASALIALTAAASGSAFAQHDEHAKDNNYRSAEMQQQGGYQRDNHRTDGAFNRVSDSGGYGHRDHQDRRQYAHNDYRNRNYHQVPSYRHDRHERAQHRDDHRDHHGN